MKFRRKEQDLISNQDSKKELPEGGRSFGNGLGRTACI